MVRGVSYFNYHLQVTLLVESYAVFLSLFKLLIYSMNKRKYIVDKTFVSRW